MTSQPSAGARGRIIEPTPPAPVPAPRKAPPEKQEDKSTLQAKAPEEQTSDADVVRAGSSMAIATLISRITGFIRTVLITSSLGVAIASAFQTANQIPNLITEIVLGAVLTSLVVPVLIHAEKEDPDRGEEFVRRLFTLSVAILGFVTIASVICAPLLTGMMLDRGGEVNVAQATSMAYLLLPQIFFYGLFALFQAILNTKNIFAPGAWAPVVNNVISIAVLLAYWTLPGELDPRAPSAITDPHVLLLGIGTTAGVVVQCLILVPYLRRAGINLKPLWGIDARLRQFGGMAVAIIAYVAISQAGYVVTSRIASMSDAGAPAIYQNHWLLLQVPYGIIGVTLLTAIMPRLSRNAANGDEDAVVRDLTLGTKLTFIALVPIVIFFTGFGVPIAQGLFGYGRLDPHAAELLGLTLSFSAFTLIPYALVLLHLRVFYAREEAWTPTFIIAGITVTKVVLSLAAPHIASSPDRVVILLGAANGFGFIAGAVIGAFLLQRQLGSLGGKAVMDTTKWTAIAGGVGLVVALALNWMLDRFLPSTSVVTLLSVAACGVVFLIVAGLVLSKSGLPEVLNLGRALQRIPGMRRFINISDDAGIQVERPDLIEIQPQYTLDAFNSSPVPPPMSAGIVRGPSLVPGAPVSDGRFRLLKDHGAVPGARFWQAREQATGRMVALVFVDTTNQAPLAPASPAEVAKRSAAVSRNTRKLGDLDLPTVADNIEILSYRTGCLVVSDWIEGTELKAVAAAGNLDSHAVAQALAPMLDDVATAHEAGLCYGVENRNRFRVSTDGIVRLAFPAVLNRATPESDNESVDGAIKLLVSASSSVPRALRELDTNDQRAAAEQLRALAPDGETLPVETAPEPEPEATAGFGGRSFSNSSVVMLGVMATGFVVGMAAFTVWIMSLLGSDSPVNPVESTTTATKPPVVLPVDAAVEKPSEKPTDWVLDKADTGVEITLESPAELEVLVVEHAGATGTKFRVMGADGQAWAQGSLRPGRNDIALPGEEAGSVAFWVEELPASKKVTLTEVKVVGQP